MRSKSIFLTVLLACCSMLLAAQGTWTQKADYGGFARLAAAGFTIGEKGYVGIGTPTWDDQYYKDFWEFDPATNVWTQKADFGGTARAFAVGFSIGDYGYLGTGTDHTAALRDFWQYDPSANIWTQKADAGGTTDGRWSAVGFSIGNKGYIGTGDKQYGHSKDFWEYDPANDSWTRKSDFGGVDRQFAAAFVIDGKGYVGTGYNGSHLNDLWEYNPVTDKWIQKANFPGGSRGGAVAFAIDSLGYLGTGYGYSIGFMNDFWSYDPATNLWTQKAAMGEIARDLAVGFSINGKGYVGTGQMPNYPYPPMEDFWQYTPVGTTTCAVPVSLHAVKITTSTAKLDWDDVSGTAGYGIRYKIVGDKEWTLKTATTSAKKIEGLQPGTEYVWSVRTYCSFTPPAVTSAWSPNQSFTTAALRLETPVSNSLDVYPNPFQQSATITYSTMDDASVQMALYDISGKLMKTLVNANVSSGMHTLSLSSEGLSQGIYLLKFQVNDELIVKKVVME